MNLSIGEQSVTNNTKGYFWVFFSLKKIKKKKKILQLLEMHTKAAIERTSQS